MIIQAQDDAATLIHVHNANHDRWYVAKPAGEDPKIGEVATLRSAEGVEFRCFVSGLTEQGEMILALWP